MMLLMGTAMNYVQLCQSTEVDKCEPYELINLLTPLYNRFAQVEQISKEAIYPSCCCETKLEVW